MADKKIVLPKVLHFFVPSLVGILLFLVPFRANGEPVLIINLIINKTKELLGGTLVPIVILILFNSAICSLIGSLRPGTFNYYWRTFFETSIGNCFVRFPVPDNVFCVLW